MRNGWIQMLEIGASAAVQVGSGTSRPGLKGSHEPLAGRGKPITEGGGGFNHRA